MEEKPLKNVYFHFRFKFLAITAISFLLYIILSSSFDFSEFSSSSQFKLMGPFLILSGIFYFVFKKVPIKCPSCSKLIATRKDWHCPDCNKKQGKERYLMDKCIHCKQMLSTSFCEHCKEEFRL
ncbi:MAG: hypothetical protein KAR45_14300 [Desulfobacteraceae bacterium]|nr:hypothetical protein [Desulfobacteraceae bacterium]